MNWRFKDLTGQTFSRWTVVSTEYKKNKHGYCLWLCRCECGTLREVSTQILRSKSSMSCGCLTRDVAKLGLSRKGTGGNKLTGKSLENVRKGILKRWENERIRTGRGKSVKRHSFATNAWTKAVKNRDGWKCRIANGDCSGQLEAHHILRWADYPELGFDVNNGITLCHYHHPRSRKEEVRLSPYFKNLILDK